MVMAVVTIQTKNYTTIDSDGKFELCVEGEIYKAFAGTIKNKKTGEIFNGYVTLYKFLRSDGTWEINEDEDVYCLADAEDEDDAANDL